MSALSKPGVDAGAVLLKALLNSREQLGLTQQELADRAGLSMRYVGSIERGDVSASVTVLGRIAEALGVEPAELLKISDGPR